MSAPDLKPFILAAILARNPEEGTSPEAAAPSEPIFGDKDYPEPVKALEIIEEPQSTVCQSIAAANAELNLHELKCSAEPKDGKLWNAPLQKFTCG